MKLHTFVICAYKQSKYLEECIKSVIIQDEESEVLLVTSTPNAYIQDLCDKYSLTLYVNEGESGITQDWEFGLGKVKTKYATIAHQDDVYFKNYSNRIIAELEKSGNPIIGFSDYYELRNGSYVNSNKNLKIKRLMLYPLKNRWLRSLKFIRRLVISFGNPICCPSVTYVMDKIERPFFYNNFKSNEDWEAWERYSRYNGEFVYISEPLMAHRIHCESETSQILQENGRCIEDYEMFRKFWPDFIARFLVTKYKNSEKSNNL